MLLKLLKNKVLPYFYFHWVVTNFLVLNNYSIQHDEGGKIMTQETNGVKYATSFKEQLTVRGMIIGALGAVVLTMSSMYVALKLGALPWPIIFVALVSMFF